MASLGVRDDFLVPGDNQTLGDSLALQDIATDQTSTVTFIVSRRKHFCMYTIPQSCLIGFWPDGYMRIFSLLFYLQGRDLTMLFYLRLYDDQIKYLRESAQRKKSRNHFGSWFRVPIMVTGL